MCVMCSTALAEHFKARNITPEAWYFNTDGAPSHFKNRFTMQSLFKFKTRSGATTVVWETCAPGHGKGPWDGIGAVVKRFCRRMERENKVYANGARDVFCLLLDSFQKDKVGSRVAIDAFVFHYILSPSEPTLSGENVWSPIIRPSARPTVTSITGIRSSFCFRVAGANVLAVRELSCRCRCCLEHRWTDCKNADAGSWRRVTMTCSAAAAGTRTRSSQRQIVSAQRRGFAQQCKIGDVIAMESANDAEGFSFWLARVQTPAFRYQGPATVQQGRKMVPNTWYITVRYYDRFPTNSASSFKLTDQVLTENAEGVLARDFPLEARLVRRSARGHSADAPVPYISLGASEIRMLDDQPSLDGM